MELRHVSTVDGKPFEVHSGGGSVYYFQHRDLFSEKSHFFIVLNLTPVGDEFLVFTVVSSKIDSVKASRKDLPAATLVEITPAEYGDFTLDSIVDCNTVFQKTRQELLLKLQTGLAFEKSRMPADILDKIRRGVLASPLIEDSVKDLLRDRH